MEMTAERLLDAFECGTPQELWERTVAHLKIRAAHSRDIGRSLKRDAQDALEQADGHFLAAKEFDALADAMQRAPVTFTAIVDTRRMAETENTGSVRSMSGDGAVKQAIAQPSERP